MLGYIIRRMLFAIPIALGVSVVCFSWCIWRRRPVADGAAPDATAETIAIVKHAYASTGRSRCNMRSALARSAW